MQRTIARYEEALRLIELRANSASVRDVASRALGPERRAQLKLSEEFWGPAETYHRRHRRQRRNLTTVGAALAAGGLLAVTVDLAADVAGFGLPW